MFKRLISVPLRFQLLASVAALLAFTLAPGQGSARPTILGRWEGESICVRAPWNSACNDEKVVYVFEPSPTHKGGVLQHASKLVDGVPQLMGTWSFGSTAPRRNGWAISQILEPTFAGSTR